MARDVRVAILGDARDFQRAVNSVDRGASKIDKSFRGIRAGAVALGGVFAAREIVDGIGSLIKEAEEAQKVSRQTTAVIKSQGNAAKVSAKHVESLAESLSLKAGIDDEVIQSGQNVLLTFRNIRNEQGKGNKIFDQATTLALDLSVALKKDLNSSAILVGKALNDPVAGLTALTRAGVQFTDQQKEQIKTLVESGDVLGAQKIIIAELESQFSGSAEAQATASAKLGVAWSNIKEELGKGLLPIVEAFANWLAAKLPAAMERAKAVGQTLSDFYREHETLVKALAIAVGVGLVGAMVAYAVSAAAAAAATIAATWPILACLVAVAALTAAVIYAYQNWGWFRDAVSNAANGVRVVALAIGVLVGHLKTMVGWLATAIGFVRDLASAIRSVPSLPGLPGMGGGVSGGVRGLFGFDSGGIVPGPRGAAQLALVHGGETILPTHKGSFGGGGNVYQISVSTLDPRAAGPLIVEAIQSFESSNGKGWRAG